ncbi:SUKH-3 domain-containing protein [Micromonospora sp. 4G57]|uniref:SUKH-3 domain-containing protein n=1 Tax=Micromonospora sicca TaxID=2202420 RepID=A0ABU5JL61_9ACTN|nr:MULTISPECIES: SUKH-3 domain-containing protein [unclassified Micromonospora]MDZ5446709.1 SUKH-3 domain-containing protein [Micromonospora sp. 4G57]MDZ5493355.1 SUKH-3 domain-containing protein [Micromonospora sp. 4G53]
MAQDFTSRLPAAAVQALRAAGWAPDRSVDVRAWHEILGAEGFVLHLLARQVLENFGGLRVTPPVAVGAFRNSDVLFEPELAGSGMFDIAVELKKMFGQDFYPIAEWITNSTVFLGSAGMVVDDHDVEVLHVADSFEDALRVMLLADREPPVLHTYSR